MFGPQIRAGGVVSGHLDRLLCEGVGDRALVRADLARSPWTKRIPRLPEAVKLKLESESRLAARVGG